MPGMKVTLSAAMRARDVSRPHADHEEAAEEADARAAAPRPAGPAPRFRAAAGSSGADQPAAGGRAREESGQAREESGERPAAIPKSAGGRPRRRRR
jgi:hypothetical protein